MRRLTAFAVALVLVGLAPLTLEAVSEGYLLPVPGGSEVEVTEGNGGHHQGSDHYSWDFKVGGTEFPVAAARGGTVIGMHGGSSFPVNNCYKDNACWAEANYVLLAHADGTSALYMHLKFDSLRVKMDQYVPAGTVIALADNTGFSSGNHLHFQVETTPTANDRKRFGWWYRQSIPVAFGDLDVLGKTGDGIPVTDGTYISSNVAPIPINPPPVKPPKPTPAPPPKPGATSKSLVFDGSRKYGGPPGKLGPYTMTSFPNDTRSNLAVTSTEGPSGKVSFSPSLLHAEVPEHWVSWSHGYAGDVYSTVMHDPSNPRITISLPPNTKAFYFYAMPGRLQPPTVFTFTAKADDGTSSGPVTVDGSLGGKFFGFFSPDGRRPIRSITISMADPTGTFGYAIGEFGISK